MHLVQGAGAAGDVVPAALRVDDEAPVGPILDATPFLIDADGKVGIGTATPATSAILDTVSTTKGFLPPRMTTAQRNAIVFPAAGLQIYNTDTSAYNFFDGSTSTWKAIGGDSFWAPVPGPGGHISNTNLGEVRVGTLRGLSVATDTINASSSSGSMAINLNAGNDFGLRRVGVANIIAAWASDGYVNMTGKVRIGQDFATRPSGALAVNGDVNITGALSKGSGSFLIDHPVFPKEKVLRHSFVESPEMMNIYNGLVMLDEHGEALVTLPGYFEALNKEYRYQLTPIGGPAGLYIKQEILNRRFVIAGGQAGMKVSWQITGVRQDPYALAHPIVVEEDKQENQLDPTLRKGHCIYQEACP